MGCGERDRAGFCILSNLPQWPGDAQGPPTQETQENFLRTRRARGLQGLVMSMEQLFRICAGSLAMQRLRFDKPEQGVRHPQAVVIHASPEALGFFYVLSFRIFSAVGSKRSHGAAASWMTVAGSSFIRIALYKTSFTMSCIVLYTDKRRLVEQVFTPYAIRWQLGRGL
jgi:hypothetical protein